MPLELTLPVPDHPFTTAESVVLGMNKAHLDLLVSLGRVRRLFRGVYVDAAAEDSFDLRIAAVRKVVQPLHIACDRTAGWIHGVDVHTWAERKVLPVVETCVLPDRDPTRRAGIRGMTRDLAEGDIMTVGGVRVTTPLRTAMDLACCLREREALAALNQFARCHAISVDQIADALPRFRGRRGVRQLRELLPLIDVRVESPRESWVYMEIARADLPLPEPQYWIEVEGVPTYRLDFAWPYHRICLEYDGFDAHLRTDEQREHDRVRRDWLRRHGWTVIVVRQGDFRDGSSRRWICLVRDALDSTYRNRRW